MLTGTIINTATVLLGSAVGLLLKAMAGKKSSASGTLGARLQDTIMKGVALCILDIVVLGALPPVGANKNPWKIKRFQTFAFPKLLVPFFMYVTTLVTR